MYRNVIARNVNDALPLLLRELMNYGDEVGSRAGRTMELTHIGITLTHPREREIVLHERKANIAAQIAETMWVLSGKDDIGWLGHYLPRAKDFSDDGVTWRAGYGKRLRAWPKRDGSGDVIDQLRYVVDALKASSNTRQAVMTLWDPQIDTNPGKDIPCNDWITFSNRKGQLDMHVALRSNDAIWGWSGINQFEWSAMLEVVAALLGVNMGSLHFSTTSFHVYDHHWARSRKIIDETSLRATDIFTESPRFRLGEDRSLDNFDGLCDLWFECEKAIRHGDLRHMALVEKFPEPMLQSWLRVLQWWWTGDRSYLSPVTHTQLDLATYRSVQPKPKETPAPQPLVEVLKNSDFIEFAIKTHNEKHAAYGDSWKRRGEMLGILANIARKVDRLGGAETSDETSADTAMDLLVYLAKYRSWLWDHRQPGVISHNSDEPAEANAFLRQLDAEATQLGYKQNKVSWLEGVLPKLFEELEAMVTDKAEVEVRIQHVKLMMDMAYRLARQLWDEANAALAEALPGIQDGSCMRCLGKGCSACDARVALTDAYRGADVD